MLGILLLGTKVLFVSALLRRSYVTSSDTCSELLKSWDNETIISLYWTAEGYLCYNEEYESGDFYINVTIDLGVQSDRDDYEMYCNPACFGVREMKIESSRRDGEEGRVEMFLSTDPKVLLGGVSNYLQFCIGEECSFQFVPGFMETAPMKYSPLMKEFWTTFNESNTFNKAWIRDMNIHTIVGNIPSQWLSHLTIDSLEHLTLSGNNWSRPEKLLGCLPNLRYLSLIDNNIEVIPNDAFGCKPRLTILILSGNKILQLPFSLENHRELLALHLDGQKGRSVFEISDYTIPSLKKIHLLTMSNVTVRIDLCNISELVDLRDIVLIESEILYGKEEMLCTDTHQGIWTLILSDNNLDALPSNLIKRMINLGQLLLPGNHLTECPADVFGTLRKLKTLDMNNNRLRKLTSVCFNGLEQLTDLKLSGNEIVSIEKGTFVSLARLSRLFLSRNKLVSIEEGTFAGLRSLRELDLSSNKLINIHYSVFSAVDVDKLFKTVYIEKLNLSSNKLNEVTLWIESMPFIKDLDLSWNLIRKIEVRNVKNLNLSYNSFGDIPHELLKITDGLKSVDFGGNNITCCHPTNAILTNSTVTIYNLGKSEPFYCFLDDQKVTLQSTLLDSSLCVKDERDSTSYEELWALLGVFTLVAAVFMSFVFYYRTELAYLALFAKILSRGLRTDEQKYHDAVYDAFVCYRGKNLAWIIRQLLHSVEDADERYRLCIHDRDFALGAAIVTNVLTALDKSRKVIFVLSPDFMSSKWCRWELEMATYKMFEEERHYIILIELESLEGVVLPKQLKFLMKSRTCLRWPGDSASEDATATFWKGLRKALGPSLFSRTGRRLPMISVLDIKEQIHTTNSI